MAEKEYNIKFDGYWRDEKKTSIPSNGTSNLKLPVNISFLKLGKSAFNMLGKSSSAYELSGKMKFNIPKIGEKSFPFKKTGEVPFIK